MYFYRKISDRDPDILYHKLFFYLKTIYDEKTCYFGRFTRSAVLVKAELPQVATIEELALPAGSAAMSSTVSPDGSFIVISDAGHQGLTKISLDGSAPVKYQIEGTV